MTHATAELAPEATVEEIAGIGRHARFDAVIDDKDDETIEVICRRGGEELPPANPSRAFYLEPVPNHPVLI